MFIPQRQEFDRYFSTGKRVPVMLELPANGETPITIIEKLNLTGQLLCLLESGTGTDNSNRYSFLGFDPHSVFKSSGSLIEVVKGEITEVIKGDPFEQLQIITELSQGVNPFGFPKFWGGAMGYFGYDMGRHFENLPELTVDDIEVPESYFMFFDKVICFDHLAKTIKIIITTNPANFADPGQAYRETCSKAFKIKGMIEQGTADEDIGLKGFERSVQYKFEPECNVTKGRFEAMVTKCKEYIRAGDIFQANLSLRLGKSTDVPPFFLYKVLRQINPSPYMSFIDFGDMQIVSSSPELLVKLTDDLAETRPIAGTRRRGADRKEDLALARELITNEKERAEHIMLVDLERNDLGRVCHFGTVEVNELMVIEEYSHVMHIVSNVRGRLAEGKNRFDLFRACFPGGTITGAPKIRSMEIIEELEPTRRGLYTGSIGFLGYGGEMEMNIVIRTLLMKDGKAYVQAGAGIVADSVPEKEYFESLQKAEALLRALEVAEELAQLKEAAAIA